MDKRFLKTGITGIKLFLAGLSLLSQKKFSGYPERDKDKEEKWRGGRIKISPLKEAESYPLSRLIHRGDSGFIDLPLIFVVSEQKSDADYE
ncbi:MAG: hypothetical protein ABID63_12620 [Pseudomonadota bacterium]